MVFKVQTKKMFCVQSTVYFGVSLALTRMLISGKNMGFLAPAYAPPPFTAVVCGGVDNGDAPAVATASEPYPSS